MMGHSGNDALMPLAKQADAAGIIMTYQNVDPGVFVQNSWWLRWCQSSDPSESIS